jgi:hypothetical protein
MHSSSMPTTRAHMLRICVPSNGAYYSGGAWGEAGGGGAAVNEAAFKAVAAGLQAQGLYEAVRIWQLDDWW